MVRIEVETVQRMIDKILSYGDDAMKDYKKEKSEFNDGKTLAYYEVVGVIQNTLTSDGVDLKTFDMDFNLEERYL